MDQLGHLPRGSELVAEPGDAIIDQFAPKPAGDQVHVGTRASRTRGERTRQPLAKLVDPLHRGREDRLRLGPAADCQVIALAPALDPPRQALRPRSASSLSCASSSERTGTAISAAPVGVGARRSDAWSINVVSVS